MATPAAVPPEVPFDEAGTQTLYANYDGDALYAPVEQTQSVTIAADALAAPYFVMNAGTVIVRAYAAEGEPVADGAALNIYFEGGDSYGYGEGEFAALFEMAMGAVLVGFAVREHGLIVAQQRFVVFSVDEKPLCEVLFHLL